jgi:cysteine-rich repeat protein
MFIHRAALALTFVAGCSITKQNPEFCCTSPENCAAAGVDEDQRDCESGFVCHADVHTCIAEGCGNGMVDPGEQCDDGNNAEDDGCSAKCDAARCLVPVTHATLQRALDDASCDPVFVAAGTYSENLTIAGNRTLRAVGAEAAIIDGQAKGSVVTIESGVVALENLTIRNGRAAAGGGIANHGALTLRTVRVEANTATSTTPKGGGIFSDGLSLALESSTIAGNHVIIDGAGSLPAGAGGGIYSAAGSLQLAGGSVEGNDIKATRAIDGITAIGAGIASDSGDVALDGTTVRSNSIVIDGHPGKATGRGAGLSVTGGTLRLAKANITGNTMMIAGKTAEGIGGGAAAPTIEAADTVIDGNAVRVFSEEQCDACQAKGGGVYANGPLRSTLATTTVTANQVELNVFGSITDALGAGVMVEGLGSLAITDSAVTANTLTAVGSDVRALGAGIAWLPSPTGSAGELAVVSTTIASNTTTSYYASGAGVGVRAISGGHHALIRNSTINANRVVGFDATTGPAIMFEGQNMTGTNKLDVVSSTMSDNSAEFRSGPNLNGAIQISASRSGAVSVALASSTVLAGTNSLAFRANNANVAATTRNSIVTTCSGTFTSGFGNYFGNLSGCTITNPGGDVVGGALNLAELADNGGPTRTHASLPGSLTIDAANVAGCTDEAGVLLTTDQRGQPRVVNGRCDIGAFEK